MRYLALGDSYTIGTGASTQDHAWPSIIAAHLGAELTNPAVNGYTTLDLIRDELPLLERVNPDLVSVLIGVNDLVQGRTLEQYRTSLVNIYNAVASLQLGPGRVVAISIPNWSVVPAAATFGAPDALKRLTDDFNDLARHEAQARGFTWVDITAVSTSGTGSPGWISSDQLHPGDPQYAKWADVIWDAVREPWAAAAARP